MPCVPGAIPLRQQENPISTPAHGPARRIRIKGPEVETIGREPISVLFGVSKYFPSRLRSSPFSQKRRTLQEARQKMEWTSM